MCELIGVKTGMLLHLGQSYGSAVVDDVIEATPTFDDVINLKKLTAISLERIVRLSCNLVHDLQVCRAMALWNVMTSPKARVA